jgi:hypothetical protein
MAYITIAQSKQTLGLDLYSSAYDDFANPGTPSESVLQEDIDFVTGVIDAALLQTYNTINIPIVGVAALALLKGYAESLIKYQAYRRFDDAEVPVVVVDRYREVKDELERLKMGIEFLPGVNQDVLTGAITFSFNSATANSTENSTIFKRSQMRGV